MSDLCDTLYDQTYYFNTQLNKTGDSYFWVMTVWMNPSANNGLTQATGLESATVTITEDGRNPVFISSLRNPTVFNIDWTTGASGALMSLTNSLPSMYSNNGITSIQNMQISNLSTSVPSVASILCSSSSPQSYPSFTITWPYNPESPEYMSSSFVDFIKDLKLNYQSGSSVPLNLSLIARSLSSSRAHKSNKRVSKFYKTVRAYL